MSISLRIRILSRNGLLMTRLYDSVLGKRVLTYLEIWGKQGKFTAHFPNFQCISFLAIEYEYNYQVRDVDLSPTYCRCFVHYKCDVLEAQNMITFINHNNPPGETRGIHVNSASFLFKTRGDLAEFTWFVRWESNYHSRCILQSLN